MEGGSLESFHSGDYSQPFCRQIGIFLDHNVHPFIFIKVFSLLQAVPLKGNLSSEVDRSTAGPVGIVAGENQWEPQNNDFRKKLVANMASNVARVLGGASHASISNLGLSTLDKHVAAMDSPSHMDLVVRLQPDVDESANIE